MERLEEFSFYDDLVIHFYRLRVYCLSCGKGKTLGKKKMQTLLIIRSFFFYFSE